MGSRRLRGRNLQLQLQGLADPIWVRCGTNDFELVEEIFELEEYEPASQLDIGGNERPVMLDLGANVGLATLRLASLVPGLRVVAVEPDAGNADCFRRNVAALLASGQAELIEGFVGGADGTASIDRSGGTWAYAKAEASEDEAIACLSMPTLLAQTGIEHVDMLKCDIEGSEQFAECSAWIGRVKNLIVETHEPYRPGQLYDDLRRNGGRFELLRECEAGDHVVCYLRAS